MGADQQKNLKVRRERNLTLSQVVKEMNVMGRMERNGCDLSTKYGLREDDVRFKHGVTEEIRPLAKLPGDGHPGQTFHSLLPIITA